MLPETIICSRCGTVNAAGDQFCGSCGAFLEWEGREASPADGEGEPRPPEIQPINDPPPAAEPPPPPPPASPAVIATPAAAAPPAEPAAPQPQAGFTVCPHCGSGNPPGRTFCHKCGKLLAAAPPAAAGTAAKDATQRKRSGGLPTWLPIVIGAGLVVGLIAVVLSVVMKPAPPPSAVEASATLTPTLAIPATITPPPASAAPGASSVAASPAAPGTSIQLTLSGATASSSAADTPDVAPGNVIDGRLDTRWEEKTGSPPGEWVEITFASSRLDYLVIYSGFQLSNDSFVATKRPQNIVVTVNGGAPVGFMLADSETPQKIDVTDTPAATTVRIQIATTYPAASSAYPGSPIDAATISEIRVFGSPGG
jgi:ribosomal protein L40E